jgi:serine/threonine protein kinase
MYLNHPYIVKLFGFFSEGDSFYIIMEYMEEGSLFSSLKKKGIFS